MCQNCSRRYSQQSIIDQIRAEERRDVIIQSQHKWDALGKSVSEGQARVNAALMKGARILAPVSQRS